MWGGGREQQNINRPIKIGNHVWFCLGCLVLKGVTIQDGCVVAANTCVTKTFNEKNILIGGYPARILQEQVEWQG